MYKKTQKMKDQIWVFAVVVSLLILSTAIVSAFQDPYGLSGHTFDEEGTPLVGTNITFTNQRTGEIIYFDSVAGGEYAQDCLNFPSAYQDGDVIQYYCVYDGLTNTTTAPIDTAAGGGTSLDIYLDAASTAGEVSDGSVDFSNIELTTTTSTEDLSDTQIINTTGATGNQKIEIKLNQTVITGDTHAQTLTFVTGTPSIDQMRCQFKGGDISSYVSLTNSYQTFDNSMAPDTTANLDLRLTTPTSVSNLWYYDTYQFEVIVRVTLL